MIIVQWGLNQLEHALSGLIPLLEIGRAKFITYKNRQRLDMSIDPLFSRQTKSASQPSTTSFSPEVAKITEMLESQTDKAAALLGMLQAMGASKQP